MVLLKAATVWAIRQYRLNPAVRSIPYGMLGLCPLIAVTSKWNAH